MYKRQVLNQLIAYAQMHFQHEEVIMEEAGYPKLAERQQIHEDMIEKIFELHTSCLLYTSRCV